LSKVRVSIVMSVYNSAKFLKKSILSVLNQTYKEFELIIINDGSTDSSVDIIKQFKDERIKLYENSQNKGLIYSLNKGISLSTGTYIARFDADDICSPDRILEQVNYLENNRDISIVGSNATLFLDTLPFIRKKVKVLKTSEEIKSELLFRNKLLFHPSIMLRKSIFQESTDYRYNPDHQMCEDFGLWQLLSTKYAMNVIQKPLLKYRISKTSITSNSRKKDALFTVSMKKVYSQGLKLFGIDHDQRELEIHTELSMVSRGTDAYFSLEQKSEWLNKIIKHNESIGVYESQSLKNICSEMFYLNCLRWGSYSEYRSSSFFQIVPKSWSDFSVNKFKLIIIRKINQLFR